VYYGCWEAAIRVRFGFTCPDLAEPARSLALAQEAVEFAPSYSDYQVILGAALYNNQRYEEANVALLRGLDLMVKPTPSALFFLAMTESKLGRQADARRTYDRAVERMNETWPKSPNLVMLKAETAKLLVLH
jgi:tetratricopeptide (TPR) repeat protein